jgi:hypothetical protein
MLGRQLKQGGKLPRFWFAPEAKHTIGVGGKKEYGAHTPGTLPHSLRSETAGVVDEAGKVRDGSFLERWWSLFLHTTGLVSLPNWDHSFNYKRRQ